MDTAFSVPLLTRLGVYNDTEFQIAYFSKYLTLGVLYGGISIIENDTVTTIYRFWEPANPFSAYPNPFNPNCTINFQASQRSEVTIQVYNLAGQLVLNRSQKTESTMFT